LMGSERVEMGKRPQQDTGNTCHTRIAPSNSHMLDSVNTHTLGWLNAPPNACCFCWCCCCSCSCLTVRPSKDERIPERICEKQTEAEVEELNRPHEGDLRARQPVVGPVLTGQHCRAPLAFATEHQNWQIRHRRLVLFTDESRFYLSTRDRRDRLWRRHGECYVACNIIQHDWFGGGSVMVWGGIFLEGCTDLYRLDNGTLTAIRRGPTLEEVRLWAQSFEQLIKSPQGRSSFRQFLKTEFSEENLLFWLACEELKKETNRTVVEQTVKQIYEDYISILSPREVSLDSRVREVINKNMLEPTSRTFDDAQQQIYTLMQRDSYPRYISSNVYTDLIKTLEEPETPNES
ncbi:hypothetical protein NFI96_021789, partial [Prochilodus magdalenae]